MRSVSRRAFLTAGSATALSLVTLGGLGAPPAPAGPAHSGRAAAGSTGAWLAYSTFAPLIGSTFRVHSGARTLDLRLTAVDRLNQKRASGRPLTGEQFSLSFAGTLPGVAQETYVIEHAGLGHFSLFLVPVGLPKRETQAYQAIVNRVGV